MFFALLMSELFEEVIEEAIATGITWIIGKVVSVLLVVTLTQGTKIIIKRIVKTFTYKEGKDKMKLFKKIGKGIKNVWNFIRGNKYSEMGLVMAASFGYVGYGVFINYIYSNLYLAIGFGVICAVLSVFIINKASWETLTQINTRLAEATLTKDQIKEKKKLDKETSKLAKELAKKDAEEKELEYKKRAEELVAKEQENASMSNEELDNMLGK